MKRVGIFAIFQDKMNKMKFIKLIIGGLIFLFSAVYANAQDCDVMFYYTYDSQDSLRIQFYSVIYPDSNYNYVWDFGDGGVSTEANPLHVYSDAGHYIVSLTVSIDSCQRTYFQRIPVGCGGAFAANFFYLPDPNDPLTVSFSNSSSYEYYLVPTFKWYFGDGDTATVFDTTHTYPDYGVYYAKLIMDNGICKDSVIRTVIPELNTDTSCKPMFSYLPGDDDYTFTFFSQSFYKSSGYICEWNFGDGTSEEANDFVIHRYTKPGIFKVTLTIRDNFCKDSVSSYIFVGDKADWFPDTMQTLIWFYPENSKGPLTYRFSDISVSYGSPVSSWFWDFGDGNHSYLQSPLHTFDSEGTYNITLTTQTADLQTTSYKIILPVYEDSTYSSKLIALCFPKITENTVEFYDLSIGNPTNWYWFFDNGQTSNEQNPTTTYDEPGIHEVAFSVWDGYGNKSSITIKINLDDGNLLYGMYHPNPNTVTKIENDFKIYPNPSENQIVIKSKGVKKVEIYTEIGKRIFVPGLITTNSAILNIEDLPEGIYFIKIYTFSGVKWQKVIKN